MTKGNGTCAQPRRKRVVYLDYNSTAPVNPKATSAAEKWESLRVPANPSSDTPTAVEMQKEIERAGEALRKRYGFCTDKRDTKTCTVLWNSGASEGNSHVIRGCVDAWWARRNANQKKLPSVLIGSTEHKASILCAQELEKQGRARAVFVDVHHGMTPSEVDAVLEKATKKAGGSGRVVLLSVMTFNNETGGCYPQGHLRAWAHRRKVPFHADDTQALGKRSSNSVHRPAFVTGSFHKLGGPVGAGFLLVNSAHPGFRRVMGSSDLEALPAQVHGAQQSGVRGGTMDVATIASCMAALQDFPAPGKWASHCRRLRKALLDRLRKEHGMEVKYREPGDKSACGEEHVAVLTPMDTGLENTLLMSLFEPNKKFCNVKLKRRLIDAGFIVSVGSACNTNSKNASHVLKALWPNDKCLWRGVLRVSTGPGTTLQEVRDFADAYAKIVKNGCYLD